MGEELISFKSVSCKSVFKKKTLGVVAHGCNPSTREGEAGGSRFQNQPGLHKKTLSQKKKKETHCINS
jgi:hypothetical protein